jgi:acetylornithine aminotransferase
MEVLENEQLWRRAAELGDRLLTAFRKNLEDLTGVVEIRGRGLMIGIELDRPCGELVGRALEQGLLINVTADRVVRLLPPLVLGDEEAEMLSNRLSQLIHDFLSGK